MHENRETSGAPRPARERGRSAKVQNHKADTHALEGSDRTILSMNQTNKEERSSAEPGERRVRAKENIVQPNTNPTQSGERVSQGLSGVREVARKMRQERFTALLHHVSVNLLRESYYKVAWDRLLPIFTRWLPAPRVLHPYPVVRFLATHPRWEPYA
jgi:RNA-directed DNA polymerase